MLHSGGYRELTRLIKQASEDLCGGRLLLSHEGGYSTANVPYCGLAVMEELATAGTTMIVVTHEMGFARKAANRVVMMDDGLIIEEGTPEHFFDDPTHERAKQFLSKIL